MIKKKTQISNIEINGQTEQVEVTPIQYSKYNPKISPKFTYLPLLSNKWWNVYKYSLAILLAVFSILSLYFATLWQTDSGGLGFFDHIRMQSGDSWSFGYPDWDKDFNGYTKETVEWYKDMLTPIIDELKKLNHLAASHAKLALFDLVPSFSSGALTALMVFSIFGLIWIIPVLVFKNHTRCSTGSMFIGLAFAIVIITLFSIGMNAQNTFLMPFKDIQSTWKQIVAYTFGQRDWKTEHVNAAKIAELHSHLTNAIANFNALFN